VKGNLIELKSNLARLCETRDFLIFAVVGWEVMTSALTIYYFRKGNGENENRMIPNIKGKIVSIEFTYPFEIRKGGEETEFEIKLVMGNEDGFMKIIDFRERGEIQSFQIDTKPIVDIKVPPP
jgi:hypothetical protein